RARREEEAEPGRCFEIAEALRLRSGDIRQRGKLLAREDRNRVDQLALDLRDNGRAQGAEIIDAAANQVLHRRTAAAIRNMRNVDADRGVEERAIDMAGR